MAQYTEPEICLRCVNPTSLCQCDEPTTAESLEQTRGLIQELYKIIKQKEQRESTLEKEKIKILSLLGRERDAFGKKEIELMSENEKLRAENEELRKQAKQDWNGSIIQRQNEEISKLRALCGELVEASMIALVDLGHRLRGAKGYEWDGYKRLHESLEKARKELAGEGK